VDDDFGRLGAGYRTLFETNAIGVAVTDGKRGFLDVNRTLAAMLGYGDASELMGVDASTLAYPRDSPERADALDRLRKGDVGSSGLELQYLRKDGTPVWLRLRLAPIEGTSLFLCFFEDVSDRKRAELELQEKTTVIERAQDVGRIGVFVADLATGRISWSAQLARMFGISDEAFESDGEYFWSRVHLDDVTEARAEVSAAVGRGEEFSVVYRARLGGGATIWVHAHGSVELDDDGRPERVIGAAQDITEQKRIEQELRETAAELLEAQEFGRVGSWAWYPNENRTKRSLETIRILGLRPGRADSEIPALFNEVLHPDDATDVIRKEQEAFDSGQRYEDEYRIIRDGETRWVRSQGDVELDDQGRPYRLVGVIMDVTDRRRAEEERRELEERLRQSQKLDALGQLAGGVAHDFNNLLMVIAGTSQLALSKSDDPGVRDDLLEVVHAAERAAELTKQLLVFSRSQPVVARHVDLNEVVTDARRLLQRLIESTVEIHEELSDDPLPVLADKSQLEQVLLNLALNARDAMPAGGSLTIRTSLASGRGLISVEDTGTGIPDGVLERIFEPFFTTKESGRGTGLGLATVYGIVDAAGGEVSVSSRLGAGTVFTVSLPLGEQSDDHVDDEGPAREGPQGDRILLVDDDDHVRATTARMLLSAGCGAVLEARDGGEALELVESGADFDVLVTDLIMPRMDGVELALRLRASRPELRVLYVSGYAADVLGDEASAPNSAYLPKPFSVSSLRLSLASLTP
jgi:PAS domain S-box-containing protein